jgi:hypothetical protein
MAFTHSGQGAQRERRGDVWHSGQLLEKNSNAIHYVVEITIEGMSNCCGRWRLRQRALRKVDNMGEEDVFGGDGVPDRNGTLQNPIVEPGSKFIYYGFAGLYGSEAQSLPFTVEGALSFTRHGGEGERDDAYELLVRYRRFSTELLPLKH